MKSAATVGLFVSGFPSSRSLLCPQKLLVTVCAAATMMVPPFSDGGGGYNLTESLLFERCLFNHTHPRQQQQQINLRYFQLRFVKCCHKNTLLLAAELCIRAGAFSRPKHMHVGSNANCRSTVVKLHSAKL